jgi:homoserine dehydrogenase
VIAAPNSECSAAAASPVSAHEGPACSLALEPDRPAPAQTARLALLGCGTVGRAVARAIGESRGRLQRDYGVDLEIISVLARDRHRDRGVSPALLTDRFDEVLLTRPDVIIELLGGVRPGLEHIEAALQRGIHVVTANKSIVSRHGHHLRALAARHSASLACEASVGASIPVLAALRQRAGDPIRSIRAVLSGTCNHILSAMTARRFTFSDALADAIRLGLAEPDPTADVSGLDTAEKLAVLADAAGYAGVDPDRIERTGIDGIGREDIDAARSLGCVVKLLAELEVIESGPEAAPGERTGTISLRVGPALVDRRHPLASIDGAENAVLLDSEIGGRLLLRGPGAGPRPTAAAVLGDVLGVLHARRAAASAHDGEMSTSDRHRSSHPRPWFLRIDGLDEAARPIDILGRARAHRVAVRQLEVRRRRVEVVTRAADSHQVHAIAPPTLPHALAAPLLSATA